MNLMFSIFMCHVFESCVSIRLLVICLFTIFFFFQGLEVKEKGNLAKVENKRQYSYVRTFSLLVLKFNYCPRTSSNSYFMTHFVMNI